jgi:hypothetical protein
MDHKGIKDIENLPSIIDCNNNNMMMMMEFEDYE